MNNIADSKSQAARQEQAAAKRIKYKKRMLKDLVRKHLERQDVLKDELAKNKKLIDNFMAEFAALK